MGRLLTFNCHEAYVHLLGKLGFDLDIIDGLDGRYTSSWDARMRPVPSRARLIGQEEALCGEYEAAIAHNLTDLLQLRSLHLPKVLVLHVSLHARVAEERGCPPLASMQRQLHEYLAAIGGTVVAVSQMKADSWAAECQVIRPCADPAEYDGYTGQLPVALRVANQVAQRRARFDWKSHECMTAGHSVRLVGHNPEIAGSEPATSWSELKAIYRQYRLYVHSAAPLLDDGYNLGVVESMMTGMPVVSLNGSETPVVDGYNGYVADDPGKLCACIGELLQRQALAIELGKRARETALREFSVDGFVGGWHAAIEVARRRFAALG